MPNPIPRWPSSRVGFVLIAVATIMMSRAFYISGKGIENFETPIVMLPQYVNGFVIGAGLAIVTRNIALGILVGVALQFAIWLIEVYLMFSASGG